MIIKKMRGNGFRGVLSYVLNDKEAGTKDRAEIIGGNMAGQSVQELSKEFAQLRQLKPHAKNPVRHFAIRLHPKDKSLTDEQWNKLGNDFCNRFGFGNTYKAFVLHRDSHPPHLHIITSQISFAGSLTREFKDIYRIKGYCRATEQAMGMHTVSNKPTGKSKLYHVRKRGTCRLDNKPSQHQEKLQALLNKPKPSPQQSLLVPSLRKPDPLQQQAQQVISNIFQQAQSSGRFMQLVQAEGSLVAQMMTLKSMLRKAKGTPQEQQLAQQLADIEKQLAQNFAEKIRAWADEAHAKQEHIQQQKRRLKL